MSKKKEASIISLVSVLVIGAIIGCILIVESQTISFDARYIRTNGGSGREYPIVTVIHSVEELNAYYETNKDIYDLERRENEYTDDTLGFLDAGDRYDEEYFKEQVLILIALEESNTAIRHEITDVYWKNVDDEKKYIINVNRTSDGFGGAMLTKWHILVELEKGIEIEEASQIVVEVEKVEVKGY